MFRANYTQVPDTMFGSKGVSGDLALTHGKQGRWESVCGPRPGSVLTLGLGGVGGLTLVLLMVEVVYVLFFFFFNRMGR